MKVFGTSHVGKRREQNEDSLLIKPDLNLYAVADGVGGQPKGEVASYIATYLLEDLFKKHMPEAEALQEQVFNSGDTSLISRGLKLLNVHLCQTLSVINQSILQAAEDLPGAKGMASTLSALWLFDRFTFVMHTGDSRIYRLRNQHLVRLTQDQSQQNRLIGALGLDETVKVQVHEDIRQCGDRYLICSDGVTTHIQDHELLLLMGNPAPAKIISKIVNLALNRGGVDNITAIVVFDNDCSNSNVQATPVVYGGPFYRESLSGRDRKWYPPPVKDKGPF